MNDSILVVEDDYANQQVAMLFLKKFGYESEIAENGQIAVELANSRKYSLILMDCQMPILDGFEASASIRRNCKFNQITPIVALTANAIDGFKQQCMDAGMDDILNKPVRMQKMNEMIEKWYGKESSITVS